ncbi:hypothetical protein [Bifidobacterium angulatum]
MRSKTDLANRFGETLRKNLDQGAPDGGTGIDRKGTACRMSS